jgi:hypothetical protein
MRRLGRLGCLALVALVIGCNEPAPPEGGGGTAVSSQAAPPTPEADDAPKTPPAPTPKKPASDETPKPPVAKTPKTPEINATYWINTPPLALAALRGNIGLLEFWATERIVLGNALDKSPICCILWEFFSLLFMGVAEVSPTLSLSTLRRSLAARPEVFVSKGQSTTEWHVAQD